MRNSIDPDQQSENSDPLPEVSADPMPDPDVIAPEPDHLTEGFDPTGEDRE